MASVTIAEPAPARAPTEELLPLTSIRGIAAWWVVLFHLRMFLVPYLPHAAIAFLSKGNLAVDLFFLLSGFVISLNYAGRIDGWRAAGDFLFRRFARVYPLHLLILLGFAAYFSAALLHGGGSLEEYDPGYFLASLFLVQNWGFTEHLAWNVPAWSISTEAFAYLLFPALLLLFAPARRPSWLLVGAIVALGVSIQLYFHAFGFPFPNAVHETGLFRCVVQFSMGILLCELYRRWNGRHGLAWPLLGLAALLGLLFWLTGAPAMPLLWAALILGLALAPARGLLSSAPFVWLGKVSYATYLCHYLVLVLFKYLFVADGEQVPAPLLAGYLLVVLLLSAALYHAFERPAQRLLLRWWKRRGASRPRLAAASALD